MNIFKKLFGKFGKKKKVEDECWYNNSHEKVDTKLWHNPDEGGGAYSGSQHEIATTNHISKRQS